MFILYSCMKRSLSESPWFHIKKCFELGVIGYLKIIKKIEGGLGKIRWMIESEIFFPNFFLNRKKGERRTNEFKAINKTIQYFFLCFLPQTIFFFLFFFFS